MVGKATGHVTGVAQLVELKEHDPSGHRKLAALPAHTLKPPRHKTTSPTQLPSSQSTGAAVGHVTAEGHCNRFERHDPSTGQRTDVAGHAEAASHSASVAAHFPFSHRTAPI